MRRFWAMETASLSSLMLTYALFTFFFRDAGIFPIVPEFTEQMLFKIYFADTLFVLILLVYEYFSRDWEPATYLAVDFSCRYLLAFGFAYVAGPVIGLFGYDWRNAAITAVFLIPVFVFTYIITYWTIKEYADTINKSILRRKNDK